VILIITGTDTGVGKTIVTAALAAIAHGQGKSVAVVKPAQTGTAAYAPGETSDAATVSRLAGPDVTVATLGEYPDPLAPLSAARVADAPPMLLADAINGVAMQAEKHDVVLVEGAGGLLVPMGAGLDGLSWTIADLAIALRARAVVVARAGLGTLNHTALTREALARRGVETTVVIGAWPAKPELVHEQNLIDLAPIAGRVPDGAGALPPKEFQRRAPSWLPNIEFS
jgi:dethiobiotin synthetase